MNGADAIMKCLEAEGVELVFGYPGVAICPFFNSILDSDIKAILVRQEQNAAHAASGYARVSGKVGVCVTTSGPGATNVITGIATAYADSIPLVCFTGQVKTSLLGSDGFQEADITGATESFVKYSYLVKNVNDLPRIIKEAFYIANTGRKGPVLIDLPFDVQNAQIRDFEYPREVNMRTYKPVYKGHANQIKKVLNVLKESQKPLICVGGGVVLSDARKEVRDFVKKFGIPAVSTLMGLSTMSSDDPLYLGMLGQNGRYKANRALNMCDTLIMIGARVADRAVNNPEFVYEGKTLVHIDIDSAEIGKNIGFNIPIVGDAKAILKEFNRSDLKTDHSEWIRELSEIGDPESKRKFRADRYADPAGFVSLLSKKMEDDAIYVADVGQNQMFSCGNYHSKNGKFLTSGGMGTMGYSIPAAMGAKKADPGRQVVAVCGDGSFQMMMMELATIKQYDIPVKIVVITNGYLGLVREYQHNTYKGNYSLVDLTGNPDLKKLSAAYDIPYVKVGSMKGIEKKIDDFLLHDGTMLMELVIDPMDTVK